jgi:GNAT superfamily N-acetyltransferase
MEIRALRPGDERGRFESGDPDIDRFFRTYAGQNQWRRHVGVTYCVLKEGLPVGFATVAAGSVGDTALPRAVARKLPAYPTPVLRLARLGVDLQHRNTGLGRELLNTASLIALEMRARAGCVGILVDAKPHAVGFYERYGFRALPITSRSAGAGAPPVRLFLDLRYLMRGAACVDRGISPADSLAAEVRRRASELGLSADEVRAAVDRMLIDP